MKTLKQKNIAIVAGFLAVFSLSSCLKNKDNANVTPDYSALSVINASPNLQKFDFVIDNRLVNNDSFDLGERLPYFNIYSGTRSVGIFKDQTTDSLRTGKLVAEPGKIYSLYVVGSAPNHEFLAIQDSLVKPSAGKAQIRFLNLSVNAPALKLNYGVDSTLFNSVSYKGHSGFVEVPGGKNYNFTIAPATGSGNSAIKTAVKVESNKIYTVWAQGIYDNTTNDTLKLAVKIQENN